MNLGINRLARIISRFLLPRFLPLRSAQQYTLRGPSSLQNVIVVFLQIAIWENRKKSGGRNLEKP